MFQSSKPKRKRMFKPIKNVSSFVCEPLERKPFQLQHKYCELEEMKEECNEIFQSECETKQNEISRHRDRVRHVCREEDDCKECGDMPSTNSQNNDANNQHVQDACCEHQNGCRNVRAVETRSHRANRNKFWGVYACGDNCAAKHPDWAPGTPGREHLKHAISPIFIANIGDPELAEKVKRIKDRKNRK